METKAMLDCPTCEAEPLGWTSADRAGALDSCVVLDPEMRRIWALLATVGPTPLPVLILGETGSGKEVAAEWLHKNRGHDRGAFLRMNCASLAEAIVESELFGHEKGAFTGALSARQGLFEAADGGTLFLDEIAELSLPTQAKLLRVLECGEIVRVGSTTPRRVDVRIVSATHRDLEARVAQGAFREDLFFRMNGIAVRLPPLRARAIEIVPLARMFAGNAARKLGRDEPELSDAAIARLGAHAWSGNVRELRNVMERAVVLAKGGVIREEDLALREGSSSSRPLPHAAMASRARAATKRRPPSSSVSRAAR
jgi:DNA-binding NtrC family response regulator